MKKYINWSIFAGLGLLLAAGVTIFHYFIFPLAIRYQVRKTLALENGTEAWDRFIVTPIPIIMKLYFFKVENPDEVLKGAKPKVSEVGPYVYRESWKKQDVRIDWDRDSVFYRQGVEFTFDKNMSNGLSEEDLITTINPIVHLLAQVIEALPTLNFMDELLELGLPEILGENYSPLLTVGVRELMFDGMKVPCNRRSLGYMARFFCTALQNWTPLPNLYLDQDRNVVISILNFKRLSPLLELSMGNNDPASFGKIISVDGKTKFDCWWCDSANKVDGWDIVMFPPFLEKSTLLKVFTSELKTTIGMVYKDDASYEGISGYKFGMGEDFLGDAKVNPKARCFCPGSAENKTRPHHCYPGRGTIEISSPLGIPAVITLPHFFGASDNWKSQVEGLNPQAHLHEMFLNIEPMTGIPLNGYKRIQVNVLTKPLSSVRMLKNHASALIPLLWLEEGTGLGPKEIQMLRDQLLTVLKIVTIVRWSLFAIGLAIFFGGGSMAIWRRRQELQLPDDDSSQD